MRKVCLFLSVIFLVACNKEMYIAKYEQPDNNEFLAEHYSYDRATGILYKVSYDSINVNFEARISDQTYKMKIMGFGAYLWIDTENKGKSNFGIHFPLANGTVDLAKMRDIKNQQKQDPIEALNKMNESFEVIYDRKNKNVQWIAMQEKSPIQCQLKPSSKKELVYRVSIPKSFLKEHTNLTDQPFSIIFEINKVDIDMAQRPAGARAGGMRPGGAMAGGRPGGGNLNVQAMLTPTIIKIKNIQIPN